MKSVPLKIKVYNFLSIIFVLYLVSSEMNPTIADLVKLIARRFNEQFRKVLSDKSGSFVDQDQFAVFSKTIEELTQFAPLSF